MVGFNFNRGDTAESAVGTFKNVPTYARFRGEHDNKLPAEAATNTYLNVLCPNLDLTQFPLYCKSKAANILPFSTKYFIILSLILLYL